MGIESAPKKPESYLEIGQVVNIPEKFLTNLNDGYAVQTADGWRITDLHMAYNGIPLALVEKPGMAKNIPLSELEAHNPRE